MTKKPVSICFFACMLTLKGHCSLSKLKDQGGGEKSSSPGFSIELVLKKNKNIWNDSLGVQYGSEDRPRPLQCHDHCLKHAEMLFLMLNFMRDIWNGIKHYLPWWLSYYGRIENNMSSYIWVLWGHIMIVSHFLCFVQKSV